jgi:2-amino-4-hydroxy-6-hydroxymethyldihydropteridine diphosphokinase
MTRIEPTIAYVALGANLGDRAANIAKALDRLRTDPRIEVRKVSSLLENPAVGGPPDSPAFLNAAAEVATRLSPRQLLDKLLEIERDLGRERLRKWDPRTIDLDLLLYGDKVIDEPELTIPHPRMHQRQFVLAPLAQIAPNAVHPTSKGTFAELLAAFREH